MLYFHVHVTLPFVGSDCQIARENISYKYQKEFVKFDQKHKTVVFKN